MVRAASEDGNTDAFKKMQTGAGMDEIQ